MSRFAARLKAKHLVGVTLAAAALSLPGCGDGEPTLAEVRGTVRLDGQPLVGAMLEFNPADGAPSYGTTNELGDYLLRFDRHRAGAVIGNHKVRITADEDSRVRLAAHYNDETTLTKTVEPGSNRIDFDLESR